MARIGGLLLLLIQWSNVYAWSCYYDNGEDGWYLEGSMVCDGIEVSVAIESHYCEWHRPDDPYCSQYQVTACVDSIEYQTLSCPINYSGGIQQSRTYVCQQAAWTDWQTTSNNCTANPPTCNSSSESRTLECPSGYDGQITETRISSCPDPYGTEVWSDWLESQNSCTQSTTDPVSPISVTSPSNPVTSTVTESVTVPQIDVPQTTNPAEPTIESVVQEELSDPDDEVDTSTDDQVDSTEEVKQDKQDRNKKQSKENVDNVVDDSKEIVHGFGLVLSLEILNKPMEFYQPPLADMFSITQEFPINADTREFQLDLLKRNDLEDYYYSLSDSTWERIRRSDILQ
jgi:hypothetical protein